MIFCVSDPLLYSEASGIDIEPVIYLNQDMEFKVLPDLFFFNNITPLQNNDIVDLLCLKAII